MEIAQLLVDDTPICDECAALLKGAEIKFHRIPVSGHTMPILLVRNMACTGMRQIRLFLQLQSMQKKARNESVPGR